MARITVEDCLDRVDNRFELVLVASRRARDLAMGRESLVPWGKTTNRPSSPCGSWPMANWITSFRKNTAARSPISHWLSRPPLIPRTSRSKHQPSAAGEPPC